MYVPTRKLHDTQQQQLLLVSIASDNINICSYIKTIGQRFMPRIRKQGETIEFEYSAL